MVGLVLEIIFATHIVVIDRSLNSDIFGFVERLYKITKNGLIFALWMGIKPLFLINVPTYDESEFYPRKHVVSDHACRASLYCIGVLFQDEISNYTPSVHPPHTGTGRLMIVIMLIAICTAHMAWGLGVYHGR